MTDVIQQGWRPLQLRGLNVVEGVPGVQLLEHAGEATRLVQACCDADADRMLLHADNLTPGFFDLSSREAGEILQKLRQYGVRLAVLRGNARPSSRFAELMVEEERNPYFRVFDEHAAALDWLAEVGPR